MSGAGAIVFSNTPPAAAPGTRALSGRPASRRPTTTAAQSRSERRGGSASVAGISIAVSCPAPAPVAAGRVAPACAIGAGEERVPARVVAQVDACVQDDPSHRLQAAEVDLQELVRLLSRSGRPARRGIVVDRAAGLGGGRARRRHALRVQQHPVVVERPRSRPGEGRKRAVRKRVVERLASLRDCSPDSGSLPVPASE